jgi:acyl-CoA synthetase (AMP-forming)/AMP-acid ligase II/1-acyl-sn-glycerol-3-phosphate acyltransferase/acyl carrier protein
MLVVRYAVWLLTKCLLWLRYRVRVQGLEKLQGETGPILILPNHPGYIDPPLVLTTLWPLLKPRPMVFADMFTNPILHPLITILNALEVPALDTASVQARQQAEKAIQGLIDSLRRGENCIMWPAGHVQHRGVEVLGGARALAYILKAVPEAKLVLVRTRGIWGSRFSYAQTAEAPPLMGGLFKGFLWLLANLWFFAPRRDIHITVEKIDRSQLPELQRDQINPWFEAWYNADGSEPPKYVPYHFLFGPRTYEFPTISDLVDLDLSKIEPVTKDAVNHIVADKLGRPLNEAEQQPATTFDQLGIDSLDVMEIALRVEQQFGFTSDQVPMNLGQLWALAQGLAEKSPIKPPPAQWFQPRNGQVQIEGDTLAHAFLSRALTYPQDVAAVDDLAGAMTYERLLVGALAMSKRFAELASPNVGLLLPSSVGCDLAFLGLHFAGKLPVLLNWTTGPANLAHAAKLLNLTHVVTSKAFVDRLGVVIEGVQYLYLEDLRSGLGKFEMLRTLLAVRWFSGRVRQRVPKVDPHTPAVVLFTSGSEKAPKAVPLTHHNILTNQRDGVCVFDLNRQNSVLGFLPAFHSFGMSITGLLPLLTGIPVVHHPDPTDAGGLTRKIAAYQPTLLAGTPTFVSYIFDRAKPGDLDSLRLIVVGAEKCPPALFERCKELAPQAALLEGYGITECSPVVSVNTPNAYKPGSIGKPLPSVELLVVDLETGEPLPRNQRGMLLVSGPSIFPGYIGYEGESPFRERDGKHWYVTGDLAQIDDEGFVHFGGRLKRFLKAGGEMISLPALEEPFAKGYPPTKDGPRVAVEGIETDGGRRIVLFTTEPLNLHDANAKLLAEGFRGVMRLDEVRRLDKIPVLGTGKTDYKVLRAMIASP